MNLKQLITIWTHDLLDWLTSKFDSITIGISDLAKEVNATANKEAIITAVNNAQPDLSTVAKEANATDNKQAVLSAIEQAKITLQGNDQTATLAALKTAIAAIDVTDLAKEATLNSVGLDAAAAKIAAQNITGYALQGSNSTATNTALEILLQSIITTMYKGIPIVSQSGNATISPNTWNVWNNSLSSLTVTKGSDISGVLNVYSMRFLAGSNFQLSFSGFGNVIWINGAAPTFVAGHIYEISIVESRGVWAEF